MKAHKTALTQAVVALAFVLSTASAAWSRADPTSNAPELRPVDCRFLTELVRRTLEAGLNEAETYQPGYVPPTLSSVTCQVVVTVRQAGWPRGIGISTLKPVAEACREGAELAGQSLAAVNAYDAELLRRMRIEIEALGPHIPYNGPRNWTSPGALDTFLEPGRDGIYLVLDEDSKWFTPGGMIARNMPLSEALRTAAKELTLRPEVLPEATLSKFRTTHWWETNDSGRIVCLQRGFVPLSPKGVTAVALDNSISRLGRYLLYRQRPDGSFAYDYDPAADLYEDDKDSEDAQAEAAWAAMAYARQSRLPQARQAADQAVKTILERLVELPTVDGAAFVASPSGKHKMGPTALLCLALADGPEPQRYAEQRRGLVRAMLWVQLDSGKVVTAFPPTDILPTQEVLPGQALFALARCYEIEPSREILEAFDQALGYYRGYFHDRQPAGFASWHVQAFGSMARMTRKRTYADFVFEMADWLAKQQLTPENCPWPELWGGIPLQPGTLPGISTAPRAQALAEAGGLAKQLGQDERHRRYVAASKLAARFIMQLQFELDECYYVRSLRDTVDGVRTSPTSCRIRIDNCGEALLALIRTRQALAANEP